MGTCDINTTCSLNNLMLASSPLSDWYFFNDDEDVLTETQRMTYMMLQQPINDLQSQANCYAGFQHKQLAVYTKSVCDN